MSAQLSVLIKDESLFSKMHSFAWIVNIFKKSSVLVCIDGDEANAMLLKANKQPYEIELTPGYHQILIADPKAGKKKSYNAVSNFMMGGIFSIATGGAIGATDFMGDSTIKDGVVQCNLNDGDVLSVSAKPKSNGNIKVKILK